MNLKYGLKLLVIILIAGMFSFANASGTAAGTDVINTATLSFGDGDTVNTIESNSDTFKVDKKIDMVVTTLDLSAVSVKNGALRVALKYSVKNTGNSVQDFSLSALTTSSTAFNGQVTDNFNADNVGVFVDNGDGEYKANDDQVTYLDELGIDQTKIVFVVSDIPTTRVNGDVAVYDLLVQVSESGASGQEGNAIESDDRDEADNALTVQIVFADGAGSADGERDGKFSSASAYKVVIATMSISKKSVVISDPVNGTTNPKRIPGAVIRYCMTVTNSGGSNVSVAKISDNLDENRFDLSSMSNNDIRIYTDEAEFNCATVEKTSTQSNPDTGSFNSSTGELVSDLQGVEAGKSKSVYFDLTLQ